MQEKTDNNRQQACWQTEYISDENVVNDLFDAILCYIRFFEYLAC